MCRAQRNHGRFALQQEATAGGTLRCEIIAIALAEFSIVGIHFELSRAASENQLTRLWQVRFQRIIDEGEEDVVMLGDAGNGSVIPGRARSRR